MTHLHWLCLGQTTLQSEGLRGHLFGLFIFALHLVLVRLGKEIIDDLLHLV